VVEHHPAPGFADRERELTPSAGEDAATNNIGSVTVLHRRVRVQAELEEAGQIPSQLADPAQHRAFRAAPLNPGSARVS
jgi:hypothetical protein